MARRDYLLGKFGIALLTLLFVLLLDFVLFRVLPGDPIRAVIGRNVRISAEVQQSLREQFGLDKPVFPDQFVDTLGQWAQGNLGVSWSQRKPVSEILISKLWNTLLLIGLGQLLSIILGSIAWATPTFWLGIILLVAGSTWFGLPTGGIVSPENVGKPLHTVIPDLAHHLILPTLTFTILYLGEYMLIMRSSILEVLSEDYILTARAKGMSHFQVLTRHGLRNAMLPMVTIVALNLGFTVSGAIYIETVFSYDGLGNLVQTALVKQDYPLLQGAFLLLAVSVIIANVLADFLYTYLDPRVKAN